MEEKIKDICGTLDRLALILSGGEVQRYHQEGYEHVQSVSEHTWRLLVILLHFFPFSSRKLLVSALYHDVVERYTGDIPVTVKINSPETADILNGMERDYLRFLDLPTDKDLKKEDLARLKCADYIELCITCKHRTGRRMRQIYERGCSLVFGHARGLPEAERNKVLEFMARLEVGEWSA